jgi:hypothetical protein
MQRVDSCGLSILHLHCPSVDPRETEQLLQRCRRYIASFQTPTLLVGDFNCVLDPFDVQPSDRPFEPCKLSPVLHAICAAFDYADIFCFLHPKTVQYSWFRQNFLSSRLDKFYVPRLFAPGCFIAKCIPTLSDHSAFYAVFNAAGFGLRLEPHPRAATFYWKLNSRALSDPAFLPAFRAFWGPVAAQKDTFAGDVAAW